MLTEREMTCAVLSVKEGTGFHAMAGGLRFSSNFPTRLAVRLKNKKIKRNQIPTFHARVFLSASGDAHAHPLHQGTSTRTCCLGAKFENKIFKKQLW
jgi:hypothetical protein